MRFATTNQDIAWLGIEALAQLIRTRKLSATEVAQAMLRRIEQIDPGLHAYARTTPELALAQAADADARLARCETIGPQDFDCQRFAHTLTNVRA